MALRNGVWALAGGMVICGAATVMSVAQPGMDGAAAVRPFKPVQELEQQMEGQERLFKDLQASIAGKKWKEGRHYAWILAELANVNHYQNGDSDYTRRADAMKAECVELARAMTKKDEAAAKALFSRVNQTCNGCHEQFVKKK
jgi:DNA repair ATPase RecN